MTSKRGRFKGERGVFLLAMLATPTYAADTPPGNLPVARQVSVKGSVSCPPLFVRHATTLDPTQLARDAWKGYLSRQPDAWGMLPDGGSALRFHFDSRALPWANLKHHLVDGYDNNGRNVGAHALLYTMFPGEKKADAVEKGELGYLRSCTDPTTGIPYSPDALPRSCAIGHGELAGNVMLLYEQTHRPELKTWAARMVQTLRRYAVVTSRPGIGSVAAYNQGSFLPGEPPVAKAQDPTLGGWQHLAVGWNLGAFSKWYELTGDRDALDFAVALANRLCNSEDANGDDGSFRSDGSFGGKSQASVASMHMHGHTHCLPRLIHLGRQLVKAGRKEKGLQFITQAQRTFDWLYDPVRNPDAGSLTGWLPEWLIVATGWNHKGDCEGCTMGDVVQTAALGAASRLSPDLAYLERYYDRAEQIYRGQLAEQMFRLTPRYRQVLKECLEKRVAKELPQASETARAQEVTRRNQAALQTATRMVGQQMGLCGFPDWVNQLPSDLDKDLPGIHMQGCCADATIRASEAVWAEIVTGNAHETRVNLALNRVSPLVEVSSCLPYRGEVDVLVKAARRVLVRVPEWTSPTQTRAYLDRKSVPVRWSGNYLVFDQLRPGQQLTVTYPVRIAEVQETINGVRYTERWRGNTIVDITPPGHWIPMYQRPELETTHVP